MSLLPFLLSLAAVQATPQPEGPIARLGLEADFAAALGAWRASSPRVSEITSPALGRRMAADPGASAAIAESFVREALAEIRPVPLLRAAARGFDGRRCADETRLVRMDVRTFERILERAHRDIGRALGSGRDPALLAPILQAAIERALHPGTLALMTEAERGSLRPALLRAAKVDFGALSAQAVAIVQAAQALAQHAAGDLAREPARPGERGVTGSVVLDRDTPFGRFVVGGPERNEYECTQIAVIVDLGGDDCYRGPAAGAGVARRMSLVLDVSGDDTYESSNDGLGSAVLGVGILLDLVGNDRYQGDARCGGVGIGGIGALLDLRGDDRYTFARDSGGVGLQGIGVCLDAGAGVDVTRTGLHSLGCGLPGGLGIFVDDGGKDERHGPGDAAARQRTWGVGVGATSWLAGGVGLFVDVEGVDLYEGGDACGGAGIEGGVGIFFDAAGADRYYVGELALGSARDGGLGVFVDASGDDEYELRGPSLGAALGHALGWAEDRAGADEYRLSGAWPGHAGGGAVGVFVDRAGEDRFVLAAREITWQTASDKAFALSVFEDGGGERDTYENSAEAPAPVHGSVERHAAKTAAGDIVRVFADR